LFAVLNFDWMQRSYLGGSEPLFIALLFASFLAVRRERWILAACFASLATVTRPVGILALVSIGIVLLIRREYKKFSLCTGIGLIVGMLYILPFWTYTSAEWARAEFVRFAIPVLPIVFVALARWMPQDRRILWGLGVVSPILAAASVLGIRNVVHRLLG